MTWQPTKQQLEDAALAGGKQLFTQSQFGGDREWQPHLPTTQGKADLQNLQLALPLNIEWLGKYVVVYWLVRGIREYVEIVEITNNDKHAALARAVIEVAADMYKVRKQNKNGITKTCPMWIEQNKETE